MNDDPLTAAIVRSPFGRLLETRVEEIAPDSVRLRIPFSAQRTTVGDLVHGGVIATLVDMAATAAAWSGVDDPAAYRGTTIGLNVSYVSGARGVDLVASARVIRRGRSICFLDVAVRDDGGGEIARGLVTYKLEPQRPAD